tara:strand:+ start:10 stop:282 length:273 start_codon:yes stop_codon:yes gene_type:complete
MSINIRKVDMEQVEDILSYLNSLESLIRDLERRVTDLSEIQLANNQLLASLVQASNNMIEQAQDLRMPTNDEIMEEFVKASAELENWEKN